jgi:hypothetical protein
MVAADMTVADQVLSYIKALAWPAITILALVMFRDPIRGLLGGIEEFEGFGIKAKVRQRVSQAAQDAEAALGGSNVTRVSTSPTRIYFRVADNMQAALRFSTNVADYASIPPDDPLQRMKQVIERLDTAIIAVLVVTALPDPNQTIKPAWRGTAPLSVEAYMIELTGYAGWMGVIEVRDILRGCLASLCGKKGRAVTSDEANRFTSVGWAALRQLTVLVDAVASSVQG